MDLIITTNKPEYDFGFVLIKCNIYGTCHAVGPARMSHMIEAPGDNIRNGFTC